MQAILLKVSIKYSQSRQLPMSFGGNRHTTCEHIKCLLFCHNILPPFRGDYPEISDPKTLIATWGLPLGEGILGKALFRRQGNFYREACIKVHITILTELSKNVHQTHHPLE